MEINIELFTKIIMFINSNPDFYFPFKVILSNEQEEFELYPDDYVEFKSSAIEDYLNRGYKLLLSENINHIDRVTTELMAKGFLDKIIGIQENAVEKIKSLANGYRNQWDSDLCDAEDIRLYGYNEYIGGMADAFEECLNILNNKSNG